MPLIGVVDPAHSEAKRRTYGKEPPWLTLDQALKNAEDAKYSPFTWELLNALFAEHQERGDLISSSALVSACPRSEIIARRTEYIAELRELYVPFRGTMVHRTMELYQHSEAIAEVRFYTTLRGIEVSCAPDLLTRTRLTDYKVTEQPPFSYPWVEHKEQVEFNAFVCRNAEKYQRPDMDEASSITSVTIGLPFDPTAHPVTEVVLCYLGPKFPKTLRVESKGEPIIWDDETIDKEFGPRAEMFKQGLDVFPEFPENASSLWGGDESWKCPGPPICYFNCLAKRWPNGLVWDNDNT